MYEYLRSNVIRDLAVLSSPKWATCLSSSTHTHNIRLENSLILAGPEGTGYFPRPTPAIRSSPSLPFWILPVSSSKYLVPAKGQQRCREPESWGGEGMLLGFTLYVFWNRVSTNLKSAYVFVICKHLLFLFQYAIWCTYENSCNITSVFLTTAIANFRSPPS